MSNFKIYSLGRTNPLIILLFLVAIMFSLVWLVKGLFSLLAMAFPFLMIATAVINYRVILAFGKWLLNLLKGNPVVGIIAVVLTIVAHPFVAGFLLMRAIGTRGQVEKEDYYSTDRGQFVPYEEVEDDFLDLSDIKESKEKIDNKYNDLF
jgi:amino acid transporter